MQSINSIINPKANVHCEKKYKDFTKNQPQTLLMVDNTEGPSLEKDFELQKQNASFKAYLMHTKEHFANKRR